MSLESSTSETGQAVSPMSRPEASAGSEPMTWLLGQMRSAWTHRGWLLTFLFIAVVLVSALATLGLYAVGVRSSPVAGMFNPMTSMGVPGESVDPFRAVLLGLGATMGGGLTIHFAPQVQGGPGGQSEVILIFVPLGLYIFVAAVVWLLIRWLDGRGYQKLTAPAALARAVMHAFPAVVFSYVLIAFGSLNIAWASLTTNVNQVSLWVFGTITVTAFLARWKAPANRFGQLFAGVGKETLALFLWQCLPLSALAFVWVFRLQENLGWGLNELLILPLLGNLTFFLISIASFGSVVIRPDERLRGSEGLPPVGIGANDLHVGLGSLPEVLTVAAPLALAVLTLLAAVRIGGIRRRAARPVLMRVLLLPAIVLVISLVVTQAAAIAVMSFGLITISVTWYSAFILAGWALVASLLAEVAPGLVHRLSPRLLALLIGPKAAYIYGVLRDGGEPFLEPTPTAAAAPADGAPSGQEHQGPDPLVQALPSGTGTQGTTPGVTVLTVEPPSAESSQRKWPRRKG